MVKYKGQLQAVDIKELAEFGLDKAHKCRASIIENNGYGFEVLK